MGRYLDGLTKRGLTAKYTSGRLTVLPKSLITPAIDATISKHKKEIISEIVNKRQEQLELGIKMLDKQGFVIVHTARYGTIAALLSEQFRKPAEATGFPVYTYHEIKALHGMTDAEKSLVCESKRIFPAAAIEREIDPRPDLTDDTLLWTKLLTLAEVHPDLHGALHGFRCQEARLEKTILGYRIVWDHDRFGFDSRAEFNASVQQWLDPHQKTIGRLLRGIDLYKTDAVA
jgi:hypothetical protein